MIRHSFLALAQRLGALSPTDHVQAQPERLRQWVDRLLLAGSLAGRRGPDHPDTRAAVTEADRYSGRQQPEQPLSQVLATVAAPLSSANPQGVL